MGTVKSIYYLLSGEGEQGTWQGPIATTARGIKQRATNQRASGDRWCKIYELVPESEKYRAHLVDEWGNPREIPADDDID